MGFCKRRHSSGSQHGQEQQLMNQHPSLHYNKTYSSQQEARSCWHVQTAADHHGVSLVQLAKLLAGGINLFSAIVSLVQYF
ncbi:unnamed protein product [Calypogeia fissa]